MYSEQVCDIILVFLIIKGTVWVGAKGRLTSYRKWPSSFLVRSCSMRHDTMLCVIAIVVAHCSWMAFRPSTRSVRNTEFKAESKVRTRISRNKGFRSCDTEEG